MFIELIEKELGRVSGVISITNEELGLILGGKKGYIKQIIARIRNPRLERDYNPNFKFDLERLSQFRYILREMLAKQAQKCIDLINKYELVNPDLKEYLRQQITIDNPHYFDSIDSEEKAYWYGFLCADGWLRSDDNRIGIELSVKDKIIIDRFAKEVGFDKDRIKVRERVYKYKGQVRSYKLASMTFGAKKMSDALKSYGFSELKRGQEGVPNFVKNALLEAKQIDSETNIPWYETKPGKIALAWLLGFYDGDGSYRGGRCAVIYSSNKKLLDEVKILFESKNKVRPSRKDSLTETEFVGLFYDKETITSKQLYQLYLGPELFDNIMGIQYKKSLERKRPSSPNDGNSNYLGTV